MDPYTKVDAQGRRLDAKRQVYTLEDELKRAESLTARPGLIRLDVSNGKAVQVDIRLTLV